jgi:Na+-transporting NADH:ubiquinone oxidoreductase subunit C
MTLLVCLACSATIASTVSLLRPFKEANRAAERQARINAMVGAIPGLEDVLGPLGENRLEVQIIELETGKEVEDFDSEQFDPDRASRDPEQSTPIPREADRAGLGQRADRARVYLVREGQALSLVVLPVEGAGYVSRLRGYLALDGDLRTIRGLSFYEHAETPGLGSEIDNPAWLALWPGKRAFDEDGRVAIRVIQGRVDPGSQTSRFEVDGISGATRTCVGVSNLLQFWLGPWGFGPYLARLSESSEGIEKGSGGGE